MTLLFEATRDRAILERWCALAEQRLEYLTEMFEDGRWRRYHSEHAFLENIREAKTAVQIWRDLSERNSARDESAIDVSRRSSSPSAMPPHGEPLVERTPGPQQEPTHFPDVPKIAAASPLLVVSRRDDLSEAATADRPAPKPEAVEPDLKSEHVATVPVINLDIASIRERYPLLRNVAL